MTIRKGYLSDLAEIILRITVDALEQTTAGAPRNAFIGHTQPPADLGDFVALFYSGFRPVNPGTLGPPQIGQPVETCAAIKFAAEFSVVVARPYAPTVRPSRTNPLAGLVEAEHANAEALLEDLAVLTHYAVPGWAAVPDELAWRWPGRFIIQGSRITPYNQGSIAGWDVAAQFALPVNTPEV